MTGKSGHATYQGGNMALDEGEANNKVVDWSQPDPAVDREREAYIALHPKLKEQYFGKYVAIYHGELIDSDDNLAELASRMNTRYPNEFVWMTQVRQEPIRTIVVRSPRIVRENVS